MGAITLVAFPLYLFVITVGFAWDQDICLAEDVKNGTDICDSPTDVIIYGLGFILAPCAMILTALSFLKRPEKQLNRNDVSTQ